MECPIRKWERLEIGQEIGVGNFENVEFAGKFTVELEQRPGNNHAISKFLSMFLKVPSDVYFEKSRFCNAVGFFDRPFILLELILRLS